MKKNLLFALPVFLLLAQTIYADNAFSTAPAPAQAYHALGVAAPSQQPVAVQSDSAVSATSPSAMSTASVDMSPSRNSVNDTQQSNQQINNLVASNQAMGTAIQTIEQSVAQLQRTVDQLKKNRTQSQETTSNYVAYVTHMLTDLENPTGMGVIAVIVLGLGFMIGRSIIQRSQDRVFSSSNTVPTAHAKKMHSGRPDILVDEEAKSEYDFMNTTEAIPAQLDLARSYIAMNDQDQAYAILKTVMEKGTEEQRLEAQLLIQKIIKKK